jgi:hypothetical protein
MLGFVGGDKFIERPHPLVIVCLELKGIVHHCGFEAHAEIVGAC